MFDGWSKRGIHYVAMILSYMSEVETKVRGSTIVSHEQRMVLVALSPMEKPVQKDSDTNNDNFSADDMCEDDEATNFNAQTHISFFRSNMEFFGCSFDDWVVCLISDNCSTNHKISRDLSKHLVGCLSHKLNLQVNKIVSETPQLGEQLSSVHETMLSASNSIKNSAVLRNLTDLHTIKPNDTRWSGKYFMLERFSRIRADLIKASDE